MLNVDAAVIIRLGRGRDVKTIRKVLRSKLRVRVTKSDQNEMGEFQNERANTSPNQADAMMRERIHSHLLR